MTELYCKGVVISNGVPDSDGDVLDKKQIKQIFTKYNRETDTQHTYIKNDGVEVIENWISETPTTINGKAVPAGSWLCTTKISNPELIKAITDGKLTGYSLGSIPIEATTEKYWFINKSRNYRDYADIEHIKPLFISFVDKAANGYTFEVMTYDVYINKNDKREGEKMENNERTDEMVSLTGLEKIAKIFGIDKAEKTKKADEEQKPEQEAPKSDDISNTELLDSIKSEIASAVVDGLKQYASEIKKEETKKQKSQKEDKEDQIPEKEDEEKETAKSKTDKVKTNKRETEKMENIEVPEVTTNFYKQSGRDEFGCKIRK